MKKKAKNEKPEVVPFHRAKIPRCKKPTLYDGLKVTLPGKRELEVVKIKDVDGLRVCITRPTYDGKISLLRFGISKEAAVNLGILLIQQTRMEAAK